MVNKLKKKQISFLSILFIIRFGDGYIMIGFSAGYFIVISTYHKEIGEVNKSKKEIFLK